MPLVCRVALSHAQKKKVITCALDLIAIETRSQLDPMILYRYLGKAAEKAARSYDQSCSQLKRDTKLAEMLAQCSTIL